MEDDNCEEEFDESEDENKYLYEQSNQECTCVNCTCQDDGDDYDPDFVNEGEQDNEIYLWECESSASECVCDLYVDDEEYESEGISSLESTTKIMSADNEDYEELPKSPNDAAPEDSNLRTVKWTIQEFLEESGNSYCHIHLIECSSSENLVDVTIHLSRPGMIIGKGGRTINELISYLTKILATAVDIHLVEFDPFK